jgi:hypothetical protein
MLTFSEIVAQVQNMIERSDATFQTRIKGYVNQRYRNIARRRPWIGLVRQIQQTQDSTKDHVILPAYVSQVIDVSQRETPIVLTLQRYYTWLKQQPTGPSDGSSFPLRAHPVGRIGVITALPSTGVIAAVSSDAGDTTQVLRIRGYDANGVPIDEQLSLNGTTTATGSISFSSTAGLEPFFSKDTTTTGVITITRDGTTIARLGPEERKSSYMKWHLYPKPVDSDILYLTVKKDVQNLINDEDVVEIQHIEDALIMGAYAQSLEEKRQFSKAAQAWQNYEREIQLAIDQEPEFAQNFEDQLTPDIRREEVDIPDNGV